jgi:4-hydroxy 2-oxovalerate aldolase
MVNIIENTLRDGSYKIDFQFTKEQTHAIVHGLFNLGFQYIEVGHGLGLGAWNNPKYGLAKENDETYLRVAKDAAPEAVICAFFIPGIGTKTDIDLASNCGLNMIRIGSNVDTFKSTREFAHYAAEKGIRVAINLMKSYGVKRYEFTKIAREIESWGIAEVIYLVDSAGSMTPDQVFEYISETRDQVATPIGFHGHNNLALAMANSLKAVEAGASYIDSCIKGMGRSAGNTQTEILVYLLNNMGLSVATNDIYAIYDFADHYITPIMPDKQGLSNEEIHIGISRFHTSYTPLLQKVANELGVQENKLMKMVSDVNCINPDEGLFFEMGLKLANEHE